MAPFTPLPGDEPTTPPAAPTAPAVKPPTTTKTNKGFTSLPGDTPKPAAPKVTKPSDKATQQAIIDEAKTNVLGQVLGFAGSVINTMLTPSFFILGSGNEYLKQIMEAGKKGDKSGTPTDFNKIIGKGFDNAFGWQTGKPTETGVDLLKTVGVVGDTKDGAIYEKDSVGAFVAGLGSDIFLDPLTHGLGRVSATAVKAAVDGGKSAIAAGKMATIGEKTAEGVVVFKPSEKFAKGLTPVEGAVTETFTNFNKGKQAIPFNLKSQYPDLIKNLNTKIADNLSYRVTQTESRNALATLASAAEAALKGASVRWMSEYTKRDLIKLARSEAKAAKKAKKKGVPVYENAPLPETAITTPADVAPKIDIDGVAEDIQPYVPHVVKGKGTYVYDGESIHQFKTKKEAIAWVEDTTKPSEAVKVTMGDRIIVDTKPIVSPKATKLTSTTAEALEIQKNINAAEKLATKIKGIAAGGNIADKVKAVIVRAGQSTEVATIATKTALTRLKGAVAGKENPLYVLDALYSMGGAERTVATQIMAKTVTDKLGKSYKLSQAVKDNANKDIWDKIAPEQKAQIIQHLKDFLGGAGTTADTAAVLKELTALVGKTQAKAILDTGILTKGTKAAQTAVEKILANLPNGANKTYASVMELIEGVRVGDVVDYSALEKILNYLDPEFKTLQSVAEAAGEKLPYEQLKNILVAKGPQTIYDSERRMDLMNAATLMKAQGLAFSDISGAYAAGRLNGAIKLDKATMFERQAASTRIASYANSSEPAVRAMYQDALDAVQLGLESNAKYYQEIVGSPNALEEVSAFGDLALRSTEKAYQSDTKAMLLKQINQSGEAKMLGWMFGRMRKRGGTTKERLNEAIQKTEMMNDIILSVLGARTTYSKFVAGAEKAGDKHYIFFDMGSTLKLLQQAGKEDLAIRAFIPETGKTVETKYNSLSFVGVSKAIRKVIEADERNIAIDIEEIITDLRSRADLENPWSPAYTKQVPKIAAELADAITDPAFIQAVKGIHNLRSVAAIEDNIMSAETLAEDLFRSLIGGRVAALNTGVDSLATRNQAVRDWFNKFVYSAGIFDQQSGQVAQAVFQAAAQVFMKNGKLAKISNEEAMALVGSPTARDAAARQIFEDAVESINAFFKTTNSSAYAGPGRERLPFPTPASIDKAQRALTGAEGAYEELIKLGKELTTRSQVLAWERKFTKAQKALDDARQQAWNNSIPTRHWSNGEWVASNKYNHKLATAEARRKAEDTVMTEEGLIPKSATDTPVRYPSHVKLNRKESAKWLEEWRKKNNVRVTDMHKGLIEEKAQQVLDDLPQLEKLGLDEAELGQRLNQEEIARVHDDASIEVNVTSMIDDTEYKMSSLFEEPGRVQKSRGTTFRERHSATSQRWNVQPLLVRGETSLKTNIAKLADVAHHLRGKYVKAFKNQPLEVRAIAFSKSFKYALAGIDAPATESFVIQQMAKDLRAMIDTTFGNPQTMEVVTKGIDPEAIRKAFGKFGLAKEWMPYIQNPAELADLLRKLPFAELPDDLKALGDGVENIAKEQWTKRANKFAESGEDPFLVLTRIMSAVQFVKHERVIVNDFHSRFGWQNFYNSAEEATAAGWVQLKGTSMNGMDFTKMLPGVPEGGLYDPFIAKEFFSLNREWNAIFHSKGLHPKVQLMMNWAGFFKETQTILMPRHHVTNAFGDTTISILNGTIDPRHWAIAWRMGTRYAKDDLKTQLGKAKIDNKIENLGRLGKNYAREVGESSTRKPITLTLSNNGKITTQTLDEGDLLSALEERNAAISNLFQNDIMGLQDSVLENVIRPGSQKSLKEKTFALVRTSREKVTKAPGNAAAWYGNIPRLADALRIIEERSFRTLDDALDAAVMEIQRLHPTVQSLASGERKSTRIAITYYTWLRVAHNTFIDMAVNHAGAMMFPSKLQFNIAETNQMDPSSPGRPWSPEAIRDYPSYLTTGAYGPMWKDSMGKPVLIKPSWLPLDVLSTWSFLYDPSKAPLDQASQTIFDAGNIITKSANVAIQPFLAVGMGTNPQTQQKITKDAKGLQDVALSNFGQVALLKALTDYSPGNKEKTPEDKQRTLRNIFTGLRETAVDTPKNRANATRETKAILKRLAEKPTK